MRASNLSNVGARCVSLSPLSKGSGADHRLLRYSVRDAARPRRVLQHHADAGLSQLRPSRSDIRDRAADRQGGARTRLRSARIAPPQSRAAGSRCPTPTPSARSMTAANTKRTWTARSTRRLAGFPARRAEAKSRGKLLGLGFANYVESSIGSPKERADLIVHRDLIEVVIGTQPAGQGHETSFAQVTADLLGVPFEQVRITLGDTDIVSAGGGTHSGRSMRHASTVIALGSVDLIAKGQAIAGASGRCAARQSRVRRRVLSRRREQSHVELVRIVFTRGPGRLAGGIAGRLARAARQ